MTQKPQAPGWAPHLKVWVRDKRGYIGSSDTVSPNLRESETKRGPLSQSGQRPPRLCKERGTSREKEFKTIEELVALLGSRGVKTNEQTAAALRREGYYAIVNGYKDPFLDREAMQSSPSDVYKPGTTFEQIYDLSKLDRDLRMALSPSLISAESIAKNAVVYSFCDHYRKADAYLERSNYTTAHDMLVPDSFNGNRRRERERRLNTLMSIFSHKLTLDDRTRPFIRHYLESYGEVPLWVLQNDLTFGNIEHFYQLQKRGVQNETCRIVAQMVDRGQRNAGAAPRITPTYAIAL